jgi:hypothetical protein
VLLCFERDPTECHRSALAERLEERLSLQVRELGRRTMDVRSARLARRGAPDVRLHQLKLRRHPQGAMGGRRPQLGDAILWM